MDAACGTGLGGEKNAVVEGGSDAGSDNIEARVEGRCL